MDRELIDSIWYKDSRNTMEHIISDYFNGFRLILRSYKTGYKFYIAVRRYKKHGIEDNLIGNTPVAYFKDCDIEEAKIKAIEHYKFMIS